MTASILYLFLKQALCQLPIYDYFPIYFFILTDLSAKTDGTDHFFFLGIIGYISFCFITFKIKARPFLAGLSNLLLNAFLSQVISFILFYIICCSCCVHILFDQFIRLNILRFPLLSLRNCF